MSDSLRPHKPQHARPPCQSPTPGVHPNQGPSNLLILCRPLLLLLSIFPSIRVFSNELASGSQRTGASASVFSIIFQGQFPLIGLLSLLSKGLSRVLSSTTVLKHQFFSAQLSHAYMTTGKIVVLTVWSFVGRVTSLLFHLQSRFVTAFLLRSNSTVQYC